MITVVNLSKILTVKYPCMSLHPSEIISDLNEHIIFVRSIFLPICIYASASFEKGVLAFRAVFENILLFSFEHVQYICLFNDNSC